jgi:hypothetical protein
MEKIKRPGSIARENPVDYRKKKKIGVHASREWNGINGTGSWVDLVWPRLVAVH